MERNHRWEEREKIRRGKFRFEAIRIMNRAIAIDVNKLNENQLFGYEFEPARCRERRTSQSWFNWNLHKDVINIKNLISFSLAQRFIDSSALSAIVYAFKQLG